MKILKVVLAFLAVFSIFPSIPTFPQSQSAEGHLVGTLSDPSGATIAEATIAARAEGSSNLFHKQYQDAYGYPALGQTYLFGLRYQFAGRN